MTTHNSNNNDNNKKDTKDKGIIASPSNYRWFAISNWMVNDSYLIFRLLFQVLVHNFKKNTVSEWSVNRKLSISDFSTAQTIWTAALAQLLASSTLAIRHTLSYNKFFYKDIETEKWQKFENNPKTHLRWSLGKYLDVYFNLPGIFSKK